MLVLLRRPGVGIRRIHALSSGNANTNEGERAKISRVRTSTPQEWQRIYSETQEEDGPYSRRDGRWEMLDPRPDSQPTYADLASDTGQTHDSMAGVQL